MEKIIGFQIRLAQIRMNNQIFDLNDFLNPVKRVYASHDLASLGIDAIPVISSVLDGTAQNKFGISYRTFDEVLRCVIVSARIIGPKALLLKDSLIVELKNENSCIVEEARQALESICNFKGEYKND